MHTESLLLRIMFVQIPNSEWEKEKKQKKYNKKVKKIRKAVETLLWPGSWYRFACQQRSKGIWDRAVKLFAEGEAYELERGEGRDWSLGGHNVLDWNSTWSMFLNRYKLLPCAKKWC